MIEKIQMQTKNKIKEEKKKKNWICIGPILMEVWTTKKKQEHLNSFSPPCQISRKKITPKIKIGFLAKKFFFFVFCFCLIFVFGFCFLKDEKNRLLEIKRFLVFSMYHFYIKKEKWKTNLFFSKWDPILWDFLSFLFSSSFSCFFFSFSLFLFRFFFLLFPSSLFLFYFFSHKIVFFFLLVFFFFSFFFFSFFFFSFSFSFLKRFRKMKN